MAKGQPHTMRDDLCNHLQLTDEELTVRAGQLLSEVLHRYSQFSVSTIDSFFHQVIRNFAREIGLQGNFTISLDTDNILIQVVDQLLAEIGQEENKASRKWLTEFAGNRLEEGNSWDFRNSIYRLSNQLITEEFKGFADQLLKLTAEDFYQVQLGLNNIQKQFESNVKKMAVEGVQIIEAYGGVETFKRKKSGPAQLFIKISDGDFEVSEGRKKAKDNPEDWLNKEQLLKDNRLYSALQEQILPKYSELLDYIDANSIAYQSAAVGSRYLYTLGILSVISRYLQKYRDDNDIMLIPDLTEFLRKIIRDSDTPYIYEKIGTRYQHFLLDEFQDTSRFQWDNFKPLIQNALASNQLSLVVGDVKQSIYRWRGGDWQLLQSKIQQDMKGFEQISNLATNYRSTNEIVSFNNFLFEKLMEIQSTFFEDLDSSYQSRLDDIAAVYSDVSQVSRSDHKQGLVQFDFLPKSDQWKSVAIEKMIHQIETLQRQGFSLKDIAILTRTTKESREVADSIFIYRQSASADPNLVYDVVSSEALLLEAHPVVCFLLAMLRWLHNEKDELLLVEWLTHYCQLVNRPMPEELLNWKDLVSDEFESNLNYLKTLPISEMVEFLIRLFELQDQKDAFAYLQGFQDAILDFSKNEKSDIPTFVNWWDTTGHKRSIQLSEQNQAIRILTIHKAKGLEFPIVFIPFLSWSLDANTGFNETILWCKPPNKPPFDALPIIPIRYGADLKDTYWASDYWNERMNNYLDAINLLYVATTRPVQALYAYAPVIDEINKSKKYSIGHVGEVAYHLLFQEFDFDHQTGCFRKGLLPEPRKSNENILEISLTQYASHPWRNRVSLQLKSKRVNEGAIEELDPNDPRQRGILLHELIRQIYTVEDLDKFESHDLFNDLEFLVNHAQVVNFFTDIQEVKTEPSILLPGGEMKRLDRLVKKNNQWFVIDFKTGKPRKRDQQQVEEYLKVLSEMGFQDTKGMLIYLEPLTVEEVGK